MDNLLTTEEVGKILKLDRKRVINRIKDKELPLPAIWLGSQWRVRPKDLEAYVEKQRLKSGK